MDRRRAHRRPRRGQLQTLLFDNPSQTYEGTDDLQVIRHVKNVIIKSLSQIEFNNFNPIQVKSAINYLLLNWTLEVYKSESNCAISRIEVWKYRVSCVRAWRTGRALTPPYQATSGAGRRHLVLAEVPSNGSCGLYLTHVFSDRPVHALRFILSLKNLFGLFQVSVRLPLHFQRSLGMFQFYCYRKTFLQRFIVSIITSKCDPTTGRCSYFI